ncbi:MAG TPA: hypothetical protein VMV73_06270 [Candidatus Dormibacteraeota bacterium]|nr:hypothetical protein [Candidatus Dormibacteraeota bacterium]
MHARTAGFTAIETVVAAGILALVIGAVSTAMLAQSRSLSDGAIADALGSEVREEARIAADALKYDGSTILPASVPTSLPMPIGSPLPITLSLSEIDLGDGGLEITTRAITEVAQGSQSRSATLSLLRRMPEPGSEIMASAPVAAPLGAP